MPSPEAYREASDDEAAEALLRQCFDRPEVKEAEEALRKAEEHERQEEERREAEAIAAERAKKERQALAKQRRRIPAERSEPSEVPSRRPLLKHIVLALIATLTPAAVVVYFLSGRDPRPPPDTARLLTSSPVPSSTVPADGAPTAAAPTTASAAPSVATAAPTSAPRPSATHVARPPATALPLLTTVPATPSSATSSALPKVIN